MKKILAVTLLAASVAAPTIAADNFSGAYAGITAGFSSLKGKGSFVVDDKGTGISVVDVVATTAGTFAQTGFNGGVRFGYGMLMDAFYIGADLGAVFNSNSDGTPWTLTNNGIALTGTNTSGTVTGAGLTQFGNVVKTLDFKQKESFSLALRFGYLATQKAMLFLSLGLNYARYAATVNYLTATTNNLTIGGTSGAYTISGVGAGTTPITDFSGSGFPKAATARALTFVPGFGAEIMLGNNLAFRTDFSYDLGKGLFGSLDTSALPNGIKTTRTSFNVGLSYHF